MAMPEQQWGQQIAWTTNASEHAVSKPILVQGGHHQNLNEVMSPKSSESSSLYVKMAENVLGSSPTTVVAAKYNDSKKNKEKDSEGSSMNHANGLDTSNRANISPREKIDGNMGGASSGVVSSQQMLHSSNELHDNGMVPYQNAVQNSMDMVNFYSDQINNTNGVLSGNVESPNVIGDYSQMYQQQQRQQNSNVPVMQQYALQQMGYNPYFMPSGGQTDQYGQAFMYSQLMPFYSYPNTWMYPSGMVPAQAGQQQQAGNLPAHHQRPQTAVSPPQIENGVTGLSGQPIQNNFPMLASAPYFDQNSSSLYLNNAAAARAAMQTVRLVSSAPQMILNASGNASNMAGNMAGRVGSPPSSTMYSSSPTSNNSLYTNSLLGSYTFNQPHSMNNYGNSINSLTAGLTSLNLGQNTIGQPRRDSFSQSSVAPLKSSAGPGLPYYNPAMNIFNVSNTPPPNAWGSNNNSSLFGVGSPIGGGIFGPPGNSPATANIFQTAAPPHHPGAKIYRPTLDRQVNRSRLLEEFRANRFPHLQLRDLTNHIVEFAQDQHGSRFIQQKLERATISEKQMVFAEVMGSAQALMTDVFGNYVIQKFFEFGTTEQKSELVRRLRNQVLPLSLQMYGCRVIQKALESAEIDSQRELARELDGHVLKCVKDQNGNHVVQKVIETVDPQFISFIVEAFSGQVLSLSTHPYGCRVIQRILEHCTEEQKRPILEELHENIKNLVLDQYGNYVIQHVLEHGAQEDRSRIIKEMSGEILRLSQHKFASNVIEKCVVHATPEERSLLIAEVLSSYTSYDGTGSPLLLMMKDQYANYVVQKMLDVAEPAQRKKLMQSIRPHVQALRKYTYGKHIITKLEKYFQKTNPQIAAELGFVQQASM